MWTAVFAIMFALTLLMSGCLSIFIAWVFTRFVRYGGNTGYEILGVLFCVAYTIGCYVMFTLFALFNLARVAGWFS